MKVVRNNVNVGMDRNFARAALQGTGEYVWFSGQDDIFESGAIDKCWQVLSAYSDIDFVYFNYQSKNGDLTKIVAPPFVSFAEDRYFASAEEYFREIDHAPSFLPAALMRRSFWDTTPYEIFFDTHYVQMGVWLYNFARGHAYVVADPRFITCRVPEDSWKHQGGQMLFGIFSGSLEVYHTIFHSPRNTLPPALYEQKMHLFLRDLPHYVLFYSEKGFRLTPAIAARMKRLFGANPLLYWFYVWPLLHLGGRMHAPLLGIYRFWGTRWLARVVRRLFGRAAGSARV